LLEIFCLARVISWLALIDRKGASRVDCAADALLTEAMPVDTAEDGSRLTKPNRLAPEGGTVIGYLDASVDATVLNQLACFVDIPFISVGVTGILQFCSLPALLTGIKPKEH
jgi:hypothetical protein